MSKIAKTLDRILRGTSDASIRFEDLRRLLLHFGFDERIRGSHHLFTRDDVAEILNLQPRGSQAKPYQVKQVRNLILSYGLFVEDETSEAPQETPQPEATDEERSNEDDADE